MFFVVFFVILLFVGPEVFSAFYMIIAVSLIALNTADLKLIVMLYTEILNDNRDFLFLYKKGKFIAGKYAVVYFRKNRFSFNRLGITAGKKVGNAVFRNRAKRIIRQAYRENELALPIGVDMVIVARTAICGIKSDVLSNWLKKTVIREMNKSLSDKN